MDSREAQSTPLRIFFPHFLGKLLVVWGNRTLMTGATMTTRRWIPLIVAGTVLLAGATLQWPAAVGIAYAENTAERGSSSTNDPTTVELRDTTHPTPQILRSGQPDESPTLADPVRAVLTTPDPATRVYQRPESKDIPNREKRVLVLGVGSGMTKTFVEAAQLYKGYDIIIGTDIEDSYKNAYDANASKELAQQKYSKPILEQLKRIANPKGTDTLEFAAVDIHSKGLLAFSPLLREGSVSATNVTAYGPAVGENFWAVDDLTAYAEERKQGSTVIKVNPKDPVTAGTPFSPLNPANFVAVAVQLDRQHVTIADYLKAHDSRVAVQIVEMLGVSDIENHYLENYLFWEKITPEEFTIRKDTSAHKSSWLLGVVFKLEDLRNKARSDVRRLEDAILKCDSTITKADNLARLAQQSGNVRAQEIAREASATAQAAKTKNISNMPSAELNLRRAENALARVKNVLGDALSSPRKIQSVVSGFSGRISIQKASGEIIHSEDGGTLFLEKGDAITTYGNSSAELQFLEGRGSLKVGEYSRVKMEEDDAGTEVTNLIQGKVNIGPGGHLKFPHLWPGQNPPPARRQDEVHPSSGRSF